MDKRDIKCKMKELIDIKFLNQFIEEIHYVYGIGIDEFSADSWFNHEGTAGWFYSFKSACFKTNKFDILEFYKSLNVDDSDYFDDMLLTLLEENKLILTGFGSDEIEKEFNLKEHSVYLCTHCQKFFKQEDMFENEDGMLSYCKNCENIKKVEPIQIDIHKRLKNELNLNENDIFLCKQCDHYHLIKFKTKNCICKHCEIQNESDNKHANNYYKKLLIELKNNNGTST